MVKDLGVLAGGVKHLEHARVRHQRVQRRKIDALGERVYGGRLVGPRHLHEAKLGPERALAHELGVDGHVIGLAEPLAQRGEIIAGGDYMHRQMGFLMAAPAVPVGRIDR